MDYATIRRQLAETTAALRESKDRLDRQRLEVECGVITKFNGDAKAIGSNEADRKRVFDAACVADEQYRDEHAGYRQLQVAVEALQAELDIYAHSQREREMALRERALASSWDAVKLP